MKEVWKKYKLWIVLAGYLATLLLVVIFMIVPLKTKVSKSGEELQRTEIDNEMNRDKTAKIPEMEEQRGYFQENKSRLDGLLDSDEEVDFIRKLELLSEETGNKINLKIDNPLPKSENKSRENDSESKKDGQTAENIMSMLPYPDYVVFNISLEGTYEGFFNFIRKLENFEYYVNVVSLELQRGVSEKEKVITDDNPFSAGSQKGIGKNEEGKEVLKSEIRAVVYIRK